LQKSNDMLHKARAGASDCARIFGWKSGSTFKRNLWKLPRIRSVKMRNGVFFILSDVFRARYPELSNSEIDDKVRIFVEERRERKLTRISHEWIGATESARIFGWRYGSTFKRNFRKLSKIRTIRRARGTYYDMRDVFRACYPEADGIKLDQIILEYRATKIKQRLKKGA